MVGNFHPLPARVPTALTREKFQVFRWLQRCKLRSLRNPRPHTYDQTCRPDCPCLHHYVTYLLVNVAYFGVVSKNDILGSGRVIA
jgi:hypothetical protein